MKLLRPRWNLKHLAIAVAALAVSFAFLGVEGTVVVSMLCLPPLVAPPGRRLAALYWVAACYPLIFLLSLYITWLSAWLALGHPPRPSLDDPKDIGAIESIYGATAILMFGTPFTLLTAFGLTTARLARRFEGKVGAYSKSESLEAAFLLGAFPVLWVVGYLLLAWDPLSVHSWYID